MLVCPPKGPWTAAKQRSTILRASLFAGLLWVTIVFSPHTKVSLSALLPTSEPSVSDREPPIPDASVAVHPLKRPSQDLYPSQPEFSRINYTDPLDVTRCVYYGADSAPSFANCKGLGEPICPEKLWQVKSFRYHSTAPIRKSPCVLSDTQSFSTGRRAKLFLRTILVSLSGRTCFLTMQRFA